MMHPAIQQFMAMEHLATLQRDAAQMRRRPLPAREDPRRIELRLCRVSDDQALEELAQLNERELPQGSFVVALVDGRLVAAQSLDGGGVLTDPFVRTGHLRRLLAVRAAQINEPASRGLWGLRRRQLAA